MATEKAPDGGTKTEEAPEKPTEDAAKPKRLSNSNDYDIIDEFDFSYIPDELKDLICGPEAATSSDALEEAGKAQAQVAGRQGHKPTAAAEKKTGTKSKRGHKRGDGEEGDEEDWEGDEEEEDEDSELSSYSDADEDEEEPSSVYTESDEDFPLQQTESDLEKSDEEDRRRRRFLLGTHSFLQLRDPGLDDALIPKERLPEIPRTGKKLEKQKYLDICKELGVQPIKKFFHSMNTDTVDLNRYFLCPDDIIAICKMMENNTTVKSLNLSGNLAGLEGGLAIAKMIENNYTLTHLNIAGMEILPAFKKICEAVALNITLESLDISQNQLGDREMQWVSKFLKESTTLRELYLSRNKIRDAGAGSIGKGLKENQCLELLDLAINEIKGEKPAMPLFQGAADHPTLMHIDLLNNTLKDVAAKGIARMLANNKQMEFINTAFNIFDNPGAKTIGKGFWKAEAMKNFVVGPNEWRQDAAATILNPLAAPKFSAPMEAIDFGWLFDVYNQFLKVEERVMKLRPELKIIRGNAFGQWKAKGPDAKALVIQRAKVVCENFATPLEMLIDELRTEPKKMNHKEFKKFIKSCNLYKDKTLTEAFLKNFPLTPFEVDCESIIATYDKEFPKKNVDKASSLGQVQGGDNIQNSKEMKRERDTSMHLMKW